MKSLKKGFTLVELMVVIVIIGILAALAIPRFLGATNKTKATEFKPVLKQIYTLQMAYQQERDVFGTTKASIAFEDPTGQNVRFTYSLPATAPTNAAGAANAVGIAAPVANTIKYDGTNYLGTGDHGCIDPTGLMYGTANLSSIANVTSSTACP